VGVYINSGKVCLQIHYIRDSCIVQSTRWKGPCHSPWSASYGPWPNLANTKFVNDVLLEHRNTRLPTYSHNIYGYFLISTELGCFDGDFVHQILLIQAFTDKSP
jgi:hypothetical protein